MHEELMYLYLKFEDVKEFKDLKQFQKDNFYRDYGQMMLVVEGVNKRIQSGG